MKSSHSQRILTSLLLLPLLALVLYLQGVTILVALILVSSLALWEFYGLFLPKQEFHILKTLGILSGVGIIITVYLDKPWFIAWNLIALFWLINLLFLFTFSKKEHQINYGSFMAILMGQFYIPLLLQFFFLFSSLEIILILLMTFASDTGAYYAGSWFGKKKIWPAISPKKTWSGSYGGLFLCTLICCIYGLTFGNASLLIWILVGVSCNLAAQFGDFFESALKRSMDIKDSGTILPGHGGILDRIDSMLLVIPVYAIFHLFVDLF